MKTFSACGTRCTGNIANWLSAPIASGGSMPLTAGKNNVLWITAKVGSAAVAGTATANAVLLIGGTTYTIPLALYVFNFAIPVAPTVRLALVLSLCTCAKRATNTSCST